MIEERKESQETIDRYNKKIDCLMAEGFKEGCEEFVKAPKKDEVVVQQAAPVVEAPLEKPAQKGDNFGEMIKVLPYTGFTTMISDNETLEAGLLGGVKVETNINSRFSIGIGFNYTTMSTEDFGGNNYLDPGYVDYYQSYYGGRDIEYSNMNFDIYSKFFISKNERFRPYIGAGLGYNRNTLKYSNNGSPNPYYNPGSSSQFYGYNFGNEEVSSSSVNVELMAGSEMKFTDTIGANVEFNYMRALGGNLSSKNGINRLYAPDQQRLEDLSDELTEANVLSIFAGLLIEL
jgi:opacity protein-like surface antigen